MRKHALLSHLACVCVCWWWWWVGGWGGWVGGGGAGNVHTRTHYAHS